jgi:hypothetical protein
LLKKQTQEQNEYREVFGLKRNCFAEIDPNKMLRFRDGAGISHIFLKFEEDEI